MESEYIFRVLCLCPHEPELYILGVSAYLYHHGSTTTTPKYATFENLMRISSKSEGSCGESKYTNYAPEGKPEESPLQRLLQGDTEVEVRLECIGKLAQQILSLEGYLKPWLSWADAWQVPDPPRSRLEEFISHS